MDAVILVQRKNSDGSTMPEKDLSLSQTSVEGTMVEKQRATGELYMEMREYALEQTLDRRNATADTAFAEIVDGGDAMELLQSVARTLVNIVGHRYVCLCGVSHVYMRLLQIVARTLVNAAMHTFFCCVCMCFLNVNFMFCIHIGMCACIYVIFTYLASRR